MKIVFMGTPDFAAAALEAILHAGHEVTCVVTQPDKPRGRGRQMQPSPVKECALRHGLKIFQPMKIRTRESMEELGGYEADLYVVAAFGQILPQEILELPRYGCVNIHASLLPKYRGAAPIQWAILAGEKETGVTIMQMDAGLDTGDMLAKKTVPIERTDTGDSLHDKLSAAGAELIVETLALIEQGKITAEAQDDAQSCYASKLTKEMGRIDWSRPAEETERQIRALNSWPSAYTTFRDRTMKIWEAEARTGNQADREADLTDIPPQEGPEIENQAEPGTVTAVGKDRITVAAGEGLLEITCVQMEGKKRMSVRDFLLGYPVEPGEKLGKERKGD